LFFFDGLNRATFFFSDAGPKRLSDSAAYVLAVGSMQLTGAVK